MKRLFYSLIIATLVSTIAIGAEVRKATKEDFLVGNPDNTYTSPGGHVGHYISNQVVSPFAVDVRDFGTIVTGSGASASQKTANANAIQAAIDSISGQGADIRIPPGIIYIDGDTIKLNKDRIRLRGAGIFATNIYFDSGVAFTVSKDDGSTLYQPELSDITISGQGTSNKTAVKMTNVSWGIFEKIIAYYVTGNTSNGFWIRGREGTVLREIQSIADRPIFIDDNPSSTIDIDHFLFDRVSTIVTDNTQSNYLISSGVNLSNVVIRDGAWAQGKNGVYWNDSATSAVSTNLKIMNIRWEQSTDASGWQIYISHNYELQGLVIDTVSGASDQATGTIGTNGVYLRKVQRATIENGEWHSTSGKVYLNVDTTLKGLRVRNQWYNSSASASVGAGVLTRWYAKAGNADVIADAQYDGLFSSPAGFYEPIQRNGIYEWLRTISLDNAATYQILDPETVSAGPWFMKMVCSGASLIGGTFLMGSGQNPVLLDNTANVDVGDVAGKITMYKIGAGNWVIQNKIGTTYSCTLKLN